MPILSIIIPSRNTEAYIEQAVESITNQERYNRNDIEIIIVDDVSSDNTINVVNRINYHNRIKIIQNVDNVGLGESRNIGVRQATGKYIAYLDGDDYIANDYLRTVLPYLYDDNYDMILFNYSRFYDESGIIYETSHISLAADKQYTAAWNKIIKRSVAVKVPFPVSNVKWEDVYYTVTLNEVVKNVTVIENPLYFYRRRQGSISFNGKDIIGHKDIVVIFDMLLKKFSIMQLRNPNVRKLLNKQFFTHMVLAVNIGLKSIETEETVSDILNRYRLLNRGLVPAFGVGSLRWLKNIFLIQLMRWHLFGLTQLILCRIR